MPEAAKKPRQGKSRYSTPPKIVDKPAPAGDTNKSGSEQGASGKAAATASAPETQAATHSDAGPDAQVMKGTDGIPVHARHVTDREIMGTRHVDEMSQMHKRHQKELADLTALHQGELTKT